MPKIFAKFDVLAEPKFAVRIHKPATIGWFILAIPICIFLNTSLPFLVFISVYAVVASHWSSWQSARTEQAQQRQDIEMAKILKETYEIIHRLRKFDPDSIEEGHSLKND